MILFPTEALTRLNPDSGTCRLKYYPFSADSEDNLSHSDIAEDELIVKKQIEEDLQLYGRRPEPPEAVEIDEATQLAERQLTPLQNAAESEVVVDRPANVRSKRESKACDSQTVTTVDWNSGASPLDAWLNQSAVPLEPGILENHKQGQKPSELDLIAQETREINIFRNVHVDLTTSHGKSDALLCNDVLNLPSGAQIYYRNIMDRYPSLPTYLGCRLAAANFSRAERLRALGVRERTVAEENHTSLFVNEPLMAFLRARKDERAREEAEERIEEINREVHRIGLAFESEPSRPQQSFKEDPLHANSHQGTKRSAIWMPDTDPLPSASSCSVFESLTDSLDSGSDAGSEPQLLHLEVSPESCFWTGGSPLRGHTIFELEEQEPVFLKTRSSASSGEFTCASRGLPPPPVKLRKHEKLSFECDICGRIVWVERRLDWQ